jgi:NADH-quinone oxidoreductase subunit I
VATTPADWCIYIDSHKETIPATTPGGRDRQRNVLDRFAIDFSLCMYCGICIEVCPFDALHWSPEFEYSELDIRDLLHEKDRLGEWMPTVPPPPALDPGAAEPAEIAASNRPARGAGSRLRESAGEERPRRGTARRQPGAGSDGPTAGVGTQPPPRKETSASIGEPASQPPPGSASPEPSSEAESPSESGPTDTKPRETPGEGAT